MLIAAIKNGMVVGKFSVGDADSVAVLTSAKDCNVNDLYDGKIFSKNPKDADMKAQALKKQEVIKKIIEADDTVISAVDAVVNPKP